MSHTHAIILLATPSAALIALLAAVCVFVRVR
jgi:hypothetical protein